MAGERRELSHSLRVRRGGNFQSRPHFREWGNQHSSLFLPLLAPPHTQVGDMLICLVGAWLPVVPVFLQEDITSHYGRTSSSSVQRFCAPAVRSPLLLWWEPWCFWPLSPNPLWEGLLPSREAEFTLCTSYHPPKAVGSGRLHCKLISLQTQGILFGLGGREPNFGLRCNPHFLIYIPQSPDFHSPLVFLKRWYCETPFV